LRSLIRRGLRCVKLVLFDAHLRLQASTFTRCAKAHRSPIASTNPLEHINAEMTGVN